ncbi:uncharacterized protein EV154DRAFT_234592 [Mucor mucedo]|uniref:uncharacterized protein n=1 Tax=Mucor mucedo TaxID=29922 RepID=UPI00222116E5|nr:uncharacterized protein EV154DRAFT_234592 [Mucor mucedo]KAI7890882.1 hypothetical protein EV154DRAFT_234592 [Mucor mucedo]
MAGPGTRTLHRRTSSLMDVAPTLARFMNQISEDFSALAGPESQRTAVTEEEDDDGEELFDFTKVIEIGKNMRSFSEGFVGNGIRILNDVATRIKTNTDEDDQEEDVKEENEEGNWINDSYI